MKHESKNDVLMGNSVNRWNGSEEDGKHRRADQACRSLSGGQTGRDARISVLEEQPMA